MFFKSGFFWFWCSQCVPTKLSSSFQYVDIKFPWCPNAFLICSPSFQDVPISTAHFIQWPFPKVQLSLLYLCSKIVNFHPRSTVWHTPRLCNNLNQELSSMKWHFALMKWPNLLLTPKVHAGFLWLQEISCLHLFFAVSGLS